MIKGRELKDRWGTRRGVPCVLAMLALAGGTPAARAGAGEPIARIAPATVTEFRLPSGSVYPGEVVTGADGNLWLANTRVVLGAKFYDRDYEYALDRVTLRGEVTELPLRDYAANGLAASPQGIWLVGREHLGRMGYDGGLTELREPTGEYPGGVAVGPDGNLWVTKRDDAARDAILRISTGGGATEFLLPNTDSAPGSIVVGPDGALWFTEYFANRIGRITPSGELREFPLPRPGGDIAVGPDGNLWIAAPGSADSGAVLRMTPAGEVRTVYRGEVQGPLASGPDGRIWFANGYGTIGRVTPDGRVSQIELPFEESTLRGMTVGPEGNLWYTAMADLPCKGGGGTCLFYLPEGPGIVGRVALGQLEARLGAKATVRRDGRTRLRVVCAGGRGADVCRGELALKRNGLVLVRRPYALAVDSVESFAVRLPAGARRTLARKGRLRPEIEVTVAGGQGRSSEVALRLPRRSR